MLAEGVKNMRLLPASFSFEVTRADLMDPPPSFVLELWNVKKQYPFPRIKLDLD